LLNLFWDSNCCLIFRKNFNMGRALADGKSNG
jgi:hypothetical protein